MALQTFEEFCKDHNLDIKTITSTEITHTAQQAAHTHEVPVSNIVKSLLVKGDEGYFLILVPGDKKLDLDFWRKRLGQKKLKMSNAEDVKRETGYSIGGVPPFGHLKNIKTYIADGFDNSQELVAAAGSQFSVFRISLDNLRKIIGT